jgi:hypothetical protein
MSKLVVGTDVVPGSLVANALIAQSIFNNKFLLPRPPASPVYTLVPGNNQVTVIWEPSATDSGCTGSAGGDPYFSIASNTQSPLYNPNYRRCDVEGYRIYRSVGLSGAPELIAQFDKTGTVFTDFTGEMDPAFVPEEGQPYGDPVEHALTGDFTMFPKGSRIRNGVTGAVFASSMQTISLSDTGIPFVYTDRSVRNGITYRYYVTSFDVNSLESGAVSLESPRTPQAVVPRSAGLTGADAVTAVELRGSTKGLNPAAAGPTIDAQGKFSGPQLPTNGLRATDIQLALGDAVKAGQTVIAKIDSVIPHTYNVEYFLTVNGTEKITLSAPSGELDAIRGNATSDLLLTTIATLPADPAALQGKFQNIPKFAGSVGWELILGRPPFFSGVADWAGVAGRGSAFWTAPLFRTARPAARAGSPGRTSQWPIRAG